MDRTQKKLIKQYIKRSEGIPNPFNVPGPFISTDATLLSNGWSQVQFSQALPKDVYSSIQVMDVRRYLDDIKDSAHSFHKLAVDALWEQVKDLKQKLGVSDTDWLYKPSYFGSFMGDRALLNIDSCYFNIELVLDTLTCMTQGGDADAWVVNDENALLLQPKNGSKAQAVVCGVVHLPSKLMQFVKENSEKTVKNILYY